LYKAKGDESRAIANYKKSLSIMERPEARLKLEKLEQVVNH